MKRNLFLLIAIFSCSIVMAIDVTFRVDMSQQTVSANGVHVAGTFNAWSPGATAMSNGGSGSIYTVVINLTSGTVYEYKFINGNAWGTDEIVPAACGVLSGGAYNRFLTGPATATVLDAVCFSQCGPCGTAVSLTFQVDMSQQTVSPNGVHVAGSFNGWSTIATTMTLSSGSLYTATVNVNTGSVIEYKFINGNAWGAGEETVPAACGVDNGSGGYNRQVTVGTTNLTLPLVCFSQCGPCSSSVNLTLSVDMSQQTVAATGVHVGGSFNSWSSSATVMTNSGNNIYTATVAVPGGSVQEYKFINGDAWTGEEVVPSTCGVDNGTGGYNRQVTLGTTNITVPAVCFSQCGTCSPPVNLTLSVDMSQQTVAATGVHVGGTFNGWSSSATVMTSSGNGIYTATVTAPGGSVQEYKFVNGDAWTGEEIVPSTCGVDNGTGGYNRQVTLGTTNMTVPVVCFSQCGACALPVNLTLSVDMSLQTVAATGVHVGGSFNSWSSSATVMATTGNNIYTATVSVPGGSVQQYKFINGDTWTDTETVPSACGVDDLNGGFNRQITLGTGNLIADSVCFSLCDLCNVPHSAVFRVDMSQQIVSADGVHITGSFQGWNPGSTEMTLAGNGIYEYTAQFLPSEIIEYRFINGKVWAGGESVPEACGVSNGSGGFNRFFTMPAIDTTLPAKCFSSCATCSGSNPVNITFQVDMTYETVSADGVHLAGTFQGWDPAATLMTNIGNNVYSKSVLIDIGVEAQYKFINGITWENEETIPETCGVPDGQNGFNRFITVPEANSTLALVCFSLCSTCPVGIKTPSGISDFRVYPNPATDKLYISLNAKTATGVIADLYNTDGKKVFNYQAEINSGQNSLTLLTGQISKGIYYLILRSGNDNSEMVTRKIIFK